MSTIKHGVGGAFALAAVIAFSPTAAMADVAGSLGFEDGESAAAGVTPVDGLGISSQYATTTGMTFGIDADMNGVRDIGVMPMLTQVGMQSSSDFSNIEDAYWSQTNRAFDSARPGFEDQLGGWFLRTKTTIEPEPGALLILYDVPVYMASGEIWDIDGNPDVESIYFGTEQFRVSALDSLGNVIDSIDSPLGDQNDPDLSLDSAPWTWIFEHAQDDIAGVRIEFTGTREYGAGYGHDNLSWASTIPAPSSLAPLGALALGGMRRRRR